MMKPEDNNKEKPAANLRRRNFLVTASLGSAGVAAAAIATHSPVAAEPPPAAKPAEKGNGYQLSDHVLHYYRTTRT